MAQALPPHVSRPLDQLRRHPDWRGCCVPLAVAMMLRADFEDVVVAMRAMGILHPAGGVSSKRDLPRFFERLGVEVRVRDLWAEAANAGMANRPTVTQYFPSLNAQNRHILTKNRHAIYGDRQFRQVYDYRGVFPERRCRMNYHFELPASVCEVAKQGLTEWLDLYYRRNRTSKEQQVQNMTFKGQRTVRRRRRTPTSRAPMLKMVNGRLRLA